MNIARYLILHACCLGVAAMAADPTPPERHLYWGDTHLHTAYSFDAGLAGTALTPDKAYRFARGEAVKTTTGVSFQLQQPLDFLLVSDHAEYLGGIGLIRAGNEDILRQENARRLQTMMAAPGQGMAQQLMLEISESYKTRVPFFTVPDSVPSPWTEMVAYAEAANDPGHFTALIGFEWSAMPDGNNLHRVVMFRDGEQATSGLTPLSALDTDDPADLWRYLADYESTSGGRALAIPHNANVSGGLMFTESTLAGDPMNAAYARLRQRFEPVMEVTQIKGDSETHPLVSPNDEFADYGTWDKWNIAMSTQQTPSMQTFQYARPALQRGLRLHRRLGVNPYAFGMIGSSDSHTGISAVEEASYSGKFPYTEPSNHARAQLNWGERAPGTPVIYNWEELASGYAAVWATDNTRAAIFDAFLRREVYATTGPRIQVRLFGGWDFSDRDLEADPVSAGYARGVPMGGTLQADNGQAPRFIVMAQRAPGGAHLDRLQIVKGWLEADGETVKEAIYNVAWAGDRTVQADGRLPAVGGTIDLEQATYQNSIGESSLAAIWSDPDFDPDAEAFYYLRVLEIPTPRWPLHDRAAFGTVLPEDAVLVHQERAYTSPIWYLPTP